MPEAVGLHLLAPGIRACGSGRLSCCDPHAAIHSVALGDLRYRRIFVAERHQVIVVGGGPVGVAMGLDLGMRGVDVVVVGRHLLPQRIPKGQNLSQRTLEHFYFWGIEDELRAARILPKGYPIGGVTAYKHLNSEYWWAPAGREQVRRYYYVENERLPQFLTEEVLRKRAADFPNITLLYGWTAQSIEQDEGGVRVTIEETEDAAQKSGRYSWEGFIDIDDANRDTVTGTARVLEADYMVGCDGARSMVRRWMGVGSNGSDFDQKMCLAVFRSTELHEHLSRFPDSTTFRALDPELQGYWMFFGRVELGKSWFFHAPVPEDATPENYDFQGLLEKAAGVPFKAEFDHVGFWNLRVSVADQYQVGRVFIAGDAAHSHPPYGGFGLNNGLEDVANLGWKIAARLQGWGGDALLESYSDERRQVFWETGEDYIASGIRRDAKFLETYSPEKDEEEFKAEFAKLGTEGGRRTTVYEPNFEGSQVVYGPPGGVNSAHGSHSLKARAGHHLPPQPLSSGKEVQEEFGLSFTLLAFGAPEGSAKAIADGAEALGVPMAVIEDTYEGGRENYEARLILVRPDQYCVWAEDEAPDDAAAVLKRVCGLG